MQAYIFAYGQDQANTAHRIGYQVPKRPQCREYILELQKDAYRSACITAERVAQELANIAFAEKGDKDYTANAKLKALDLLQKQLGLQKQKIEAEVNTDINIVIEE